MKRITFFIICSLCCAGMLRAAQSADGRLYDFENGIPADFVLVDADGNTPSVDIGSYGFEVGVPWVSFYDEGEHNTVAVSTSWYAGRGTSDDWMILPPFTVTSADDAVTWRARAVDATFSDGYAVYISEGGDSPDDFDRTSPLFSVDAEASAWTRHSVSLAGYVGKTVRVAFVNNSTDRSLLYVDDILMGQPMPARVAADMRLIVKPSDELVVQGTVTTDFAESVTGFTVGYDCDGKTFSQSFADTELRPGESVPFSFATGETLPLGESRTFTVWAERDGRRSTVDVTQISHVNKVVAEELTGSWCGWCVRGAVSLERMAEEYPETFIGIAVHGGDFLEVEDYHGYIYSQAGASGYPHAVINRKRNMGCDPADIPSYYEREAAADVDASVLLSVEPSETGYTATADVMLNDGCTDGRYRMAYVLSEDNVYEEGDDRYAQNNAYAGGANGEMGGYEDLPSYIYDYTFEDVARGTLGDVEGIDGSLPVYMAAGRTYTHSTDFTLPETVLDADNVTVVAMLIDSRDGSIVNADACRLGAGDTPTGINDVGVQAGNGVTEIFTLDGRRVNVGQARDGIYIIRTVVDGKTAVKKVFIK